MGVKVKTRINYQFSQKLKLLRNCKFNHLNIILTVLIRKKFWKGIEVSQKGQARLALITLYFD